MVMTFVKRISFILSFLTLLFFGISGQCQIQSEAWNNGPMFITDTYYTKSGKLMICSVKSESEISVCETLSQIEYGTANAYDRQSLYSEISCYGADEQLLWKKRIEQDTDGLHIASIVGELSEHCILLKIQDAASPALKHAALLAVDDQGEYMAVSKQLSDLFQKNHIFIHDGKIFAQDRKNTKNVSLWEIQGDSPKEIWNRVIPEIDGLWGNQILWTESGILAYGLGIYGEHELCGAAFMLDFEGAFQWMYTANDLYSSIASAHTWEDGIFLSLSNLSNDTNPYSWIKVAQDDGQIMASGSLAFDIQYISSIQDNENNKLTLLYTLEGSSYAYTLIVNGQIADKVYVTPNLLLYMENSIPRIMNIDNQGFKVIFSEDYRNHIGHDLCLSYDFQR